ncbi:hypothetical protein D3C84_1013400 [compost metagenome]
MSNGVGARHGYVYPQANPREARLIAVDRVFRREGRFDPGHIGVDAITADIGDSGFGEEPECFRWPVIRKYHRQGVVIHPGFRIEDAHVGWRARSAR